MQKQKRRQKWIDLFEGRVELELPNRYNTLIAKFAGEVEEERGRIFTKCGVFCHKNKDFTTGLFREIEKNVRNSSVIKHNYAYQLQNIETGFTMGYYQNRRSPWFERLPEARRWLEEQEENHLQGENIDRPDTK